MPLVPFSSKHIWLCGICNWSAPVQQGCVIYVNEFFTNAAAMVTVADGNLCPYLNLVIMLLNHLKILTGPKIQHRNSDFIVVSSLMYGIQSIFWSNLWTYVILMPYTASHVPAKVALTQPIFVLSRHDDYQEISIHTSSTLTTSTIMHTSEYDYLFKLLLIGDSGVGKVNTMSCAGVNAQSCNPSFFVVLLAFAICGRHLYRELY